MRTETVVIRGPLDYCTAAEHVEALADATAAGDVTVIVDLSECDFLDSSGLGLLLRCATRARRQGGALRLRAPSAPVRRLLACARLESALPVGAEDAVQVR